MERLVGGGDRGDSALLVAVAGADARPTPPSGSPDLPTDGVEPSRRDVSARPDGLRLPPWVRWTGWTLLGLQLVGMLIFSTVQYSRYALTNDFGAYAQAWWGILHGHLDPTVTELGVPFWKINAEFLMWPIAFVSHLYPHPVILLWVQDVAIVITELVAFGWIRLAIERARGPIPTQWGPYLATAGAVALVLNPWVYETMSYDFHFEPIAALFCVLVGYNFWAGRIRRLWWLTPLVLLSTVSGGIYLVGVGLSGVVAGRRSRRPRAVLGVIGLAWTSVFSALGAAGANGIYVRSSYGYLVAAHHRGRIGLLTILAGVLEHPGAAAHTVAGHAWIAIAFIAAFGIVGVLSPWGFGMALVVLVPNLLDHSGDFISYTSAFQSWPAMPFILVGTILILIRLLEGAHVARAIPPDAEVVASLAVVGRFTQRTSAFDVSEDDQTFPVTRPLVVFVLLGRIGDDNVTRQGFLASVHYIQTGLRARRLERRDDIYAFAWSPPSGTSRVTLP